MRKLFYFLFFVVVVVVISILPLKGKKSFCFERRAITLSS